MLAFAIRRLFEAALVMVTVALIAFTLFRFVGDPVAYGYEGPKHAYKGHHPIHVHAVVGAPEPQVEFCYIDGPHYHPYPAPEGPDFKVVGGAHFYVGTPPQVYVDARPAYVGINAIYTPTVYARPTVVVATPPVGWIHARPGFAIGVVTPGVVVATPGVVVATPGVVVVPPRAVHTFTVVPTLPLLNECSFSI